MESARNAPPEAFHYEYVSFDDMQSLNRYIAVGDQIRTTEAEFPDSVVDKLEQFILEKRPAIMRHLGENSFAESTDTLKHAFFAIVAPSYEGKTQTAFVFRKVKPLYFVLPVSAPIFTRATQHIYANFNILSRMLHSMGQKDLDYITSLNDSPYFETAIYQQVSTSNLIDIHSRAKFYVLGFLVALVKHARSNFEPLSNWMKFFVGSRRNLHIKPLSLMDLKDFNFGEYFVFLDEFIGTDYVNVYIRNIIRAASITLIVANTNTNAANLVGREQAAYSRGPENDVWAVVITRLNSLNPATLTKMVPALNSVIRDLLTKVQDQDRNALNEFFLDFLSSKMKFIRPGFVHSIAQKIIEFNNGHPSSFSVNEFISQIVRDFGIMMVERKPMLVGSIEGVLATKALFLENAYSSAVDADLQLLYHRKGYLNHHFYYLVNPVSFSDWCFLTYMPRTSNTNVLTAPILETIRYRKDGNFVIWASELTTFRREEFLAYLSFLSIWHDESIPSVLLNGLARIQYSAFGTGDAANTAQDVRRNGNTFEVLSSVCIIDATHRGLDETEISFSGQNGKVFLSNLVKNLIRQDGKRCTKQIEIIFPDERIVGYLLAKLHIPYLFPANLQLPEYFRNNFTQPTGYFSRSINVASFERTSDLEEIDCKFSCLSPYSNPSVEVCTVECKFWNSAVGYSDLTKILFKAEAVKSKMCFVICNRLGQLRGDEIFKFKALCTTKKWNILKLFRKPVYSEDRIIFEIQKANYHLHVASKYSMVCIVLELDVINASQSSNSLTLYYPPINF